MLSQKVKSRIFFLFFGIFLIITILYFSLKSLEDNVVYFFSPSEVSLKEIEANKIIRIGGMVKKNSLSATNETISFVITDFKKEIFVNYSGSIPNLFAEGKGVVAEGVLKDKTYFIANKILAKHDENYMPPEINEIQKDGKN